MSNPNSERDDEMFDRGYARGLRAGRAESQVQVEQLKGALERSTDKVLQLQASLNTLTRPLPTREAIPCGVCGGTPEHFGDCAYLPTGDE